MASPRPAFRHIYDLLEIENNSKLSISFPTLSSYSGYSQSDTQAGLSALHALLIIHCGLVENRDFELRSSHYKLESIVINKTSDIIVTLNFLLSDEALKLFQLDLRNTNEKDPGRKWRECLTKKIFSCIENKELTLSEYEKIFPFMKNYLDAQYDLLKKEPLVQPLLKKVDENYGNNILKHPFYQTLSLLMDSYNLLMDDYKVRLGNHNKDTGVVSWFIKAPAAPDQNPYNEIYNKFMHVVPSCYCDIKTSGYSSVKTLNADKIKEAKPTPVLTLPPRSSLFTKTG